MPSPSRHQKTPAYERLKQPGNEQFDGAGRLQRLHRKCLESLDRLKTGDLKQRMAFIERATADLGLHADRLRESADDVGTFRMDLYPRILPPGEWEQVQSGVLQRARAFGAYIQDIYRNREILHDGIVPPEIVFEDPAFHPELHGVPMPESGPLVIGAVDLIRTGSGQWQVLENRLSTPTGISYVIQIRRILAQALPELFEQMPVFPVASFATRLSEAFAEQGRARSGGQPLVVLLSEGESGRHFFEESFLARHMGIPLARTADIVVRERKVFLKTIHGLIRIDVIYRRMEPALLDPVAFATGWELGIPGLIQCARMGTVQVINAMGCGVADNRALLPYSDQIIRYYTGQRAILKTVPTYHGFDPDQREWMLDHAEEAVLKTVCHPETLARSNPEAYRLFKEGKLESILDRDARKVVAQRLPEASRLPVYRNSHVDLEGMVMRAYFIGGRQPYVLPGGLTRLFHPENERLPVGHRFHALKDTWILRERQGSRGRSGRLEAQISPTEFPLTSRAAEAFYWIGRYLERARGTARMLNTLGELRWGELTPKERALYKPLLDAIMAATSQNLRLRKEARDLSRLTSPLLFDAANPASVRSCLALVRFNASSIRSFITPEFWRSIGAAHQLLDLPPRRKPRGTALRDILEQLVDAGDHIYGVGQRTLLHDAGWQFLRIGLLLERALSHATILSKVLPRLAERQWEHLRDDTDLTALLRLLGVLDAYHRKYRSRAYLDRVTQLLWQSPNCTGSILFAAREIHGALLSVGRETGPNAGLEELVREADALDQWLVELPMEKIFPARTVELDRGLTRKNAFSAGAMKNCQACMAHMSKVLEKLHDRLEDTFFSHHPDPEGK